MLRCRGYNGLAATCIDEINNEIKTSCPLAYQLLSAMIETEYSSEKKQAALVLIYAIIMFRRCHEMSRLQMVNTFLLVEGRATQQVIC